LRIASPHVERAHAIRVLGAPGQVQLVRADITRPETLGAVVAGPMGWSTSGAFAGRLDAIQGAGVAGLAVAALAGGAGAFVHISAIGGDAGSRVPYARTKAQGEVAVLSAFPGATILRPSVVFGPDDNFINMLAGLAKAPVLPVVGGAARMQPVYVGDVAATVAVALANPRDCGGRTYELGGPEVLTMLEINQRIVAAQRRNTPILPLPDWACGLLASFGFIPGAPITRDQWAAASGQCGQRGHARSCRSGPVARPLGLFLDAWMKRFRR
jgi:NADH dehydrogenase